MHAVGRLGYPLWCSAAGRSSRASARDDAPHATAPAAAAVRSGAARPDSRPTFAATVGPAVGARNASLAALARCHVLAPWNVRAARRRFCWIAADARRVHRFGCRLRFRSAVALAPRSHAPDRRAARDAASAARHPRTGCGAWESRPPVRGPVLRRRRTSSRCGTRAPRPTIVRADCLPHRDNGAIRRTVRALSAWQQGCDSVVLG